MRYETWRAGALLLLPVALAACGQKSEFDARTRGLAKAPAAAAVAPAAAGVRVQAYKLEQQAESAVQRYLAVRHDLRIFTAPDAVEAAWKAAARACVDAGCELLASSINHDDDRQPASAALEARVPPAALDAFLAKVSGLGEVGQHNTTSEDKTDDVIDTEARQKNMGEFRDNLRRMMATPNAKLKELDSLATRRKVLANQTEKVHVTLSFNAKPSVLEAGTWAPLKQAVLSAGHVLASSVAALIEVVVAVLPWLLMLLASVAALRALWRRRRLRRAARPMPDGLA